MLAGSVEAGGGRVLSPASGDRLVAGGLTHVRWSSLPPDTEEFELLLSLDGGRSYGLRLTPQLDPTVGVYAWRVPNLPAPRARLRLRVGVDGREIECPPGEIFTIVPTDTEPQTLLEHRAGEWWPAPGSRRVTTAVVVPRPRIEAPETSSRRRGHVGIAPRSALLELSLEMPGVMVAEAASVPPTRCAAVDRQPACFPLRP